MERFLERYGAKVTSILSGFDRLVFRGTMRQLAYSEGMERFLSFASVPLKDFGAYALEQTKMLRRAIEADTKEKGRPLVYLPSSKTDKEAEARKVVARDGVREGLIGVWKTLETCKSYDVYRNRNAKTISLKTSVRKCLHYYQYWMDETFGFMSARVQTWFPFSIQVCLNGREWLARSMDREGLGYERMDNCFVALEDAVRAQALMDRQLATDWPAALAAISDRLTPARGAFLSDWPGPYYWTVFQSEWATDILFASPHDLAALYPQLVRSALLAFGYDSVMRFLGKRPTVTTDAEVVSDLRRRHEQVRLKHTYGWNSVKMYDKGEARVRPRRVLPPVLRVEATLNDIGAFRCFRPKEGDPGGQKKWRSMRKGVADLHRRAELSQAINERYLDALATIEVRETLHDIVAPVCRRTRFGRQPMRALHPWAPEDRALLETVGQGRFIIEGFRNRDLRESLYGPPASPDEQRRQAARVTRSLRLLRAHGLVRKVTHSHRYLLTQKGRQIVTALTQAQNAPVQELARIAA